MIPESFSEYSSRSPVVTTPTMEILHLSVDEDGDDSHFRVLVNNRQFKYITIDAGVYKVDDMCFPPSLLQILPPLPPGDWNIGQISKTPDSSSPSFIWTARRAFSSVSHLWHPLKVDYLSLCLGKKLMSNVYEATCPQFDVPVIAKFARFPYEIGYIDSETQAYEWIDGLGVAPKFLGHLTEEGRVIGFLLEKIDGHHATLDDLPSCTRVLSKLHSSNILHGDLNRHNFFISGSNAVLLDFESAQRYHDQVAMNQEILSLQQQLHSQSTKGGIRTLPIPK